MRIRIIIIIIIYDGVLINWFDEVVENEYVHRVCEEYIYVHYKANCKGKKIRDRELNMYIIFERMHVFVLCTIYLYTGSNFDNFVH